MERKSQTNGEREGSPIMLWKNQRHSSALVLSLLVLLGLVLLPPRPALAETSYHKLKKKLRKVERASGKVLCVVGEVVGKALCQTALGMIELAIEDAAEDTVSHHPDQAKTEAPQQHIETKTQAHRFQHIETKTEVNSQATRKE
jgi:hypothetical protein